MTKVRMQYNYNLEFWFPQLLQIFQAALTPVGFRQQSLNFPDDESKT